MKKIFEKFVYGLLLAADFLVVLLLCLRLDTILLHRNVSAGISQDSDYLSDAYSQLVQYGFLFVTAALMVVYGVRLVNRKKPFGYLLLALPVLMFSFAIWWC